MARLLAALLAGPLGLAAAARSDGRARRAPYQVFVKAPSQTAVPVMVEAGDTIKTLFVRYLEIRQAAIDEKAVHFQCGSQSFLVTNDVTTLEGASIGKDSTCEVKGRLLGGVVGGQASSCPSELKPLVYVDVDDDDHFCGGALVDAAGGQFVVSAAHCFSGMSEEDDNPDITVDVGRCNLAVDLEEEGAQRIKVSRFRVHKGFTREGGSWDSTHDIAVLQLEAAPTENDKWAAATLLTQADFDNDGRRSAMENQGFITGGWGKTELKGATGGPTIGPTIKGEFPDVLQITRMHFQPVEKGKEWFQDVYAKLAQLDDESDEEENPTWPPTHDGSQIFTSFDTSAVCKGDSGGPLLWKEGARDYLVGVLSWGVPNVLPHLLNGPCAVGGPGVWTSVPHFHEWVQNTIQELVDESKTKGHS